MASLNSRKSSRSYKIVDSMNAHETMTVVDPSTQGTFHVVAYDDSGLRRELAALEAGDSVDLTLDRAGIRANVWQARRADGSTSAS